MNLIRFLYWNKKIKEKIREIESETKGEGAPGHILRIFIVDSENDYRPV